MVLSFLPPFSPVVSLFITRLLDSFFTFTFFPPPIFLIFNLITRRFYFCINSITPLSRIYIYLSCSILDRTASHSSTIKPFLYLDCSRKPSHSPPPSPPPSIQEKVRLKALRPFCPVLGNSARCIVPTFISWHKEGLLSVVVLLFGNLNKISICPEAERGQSTAGSIAVGENNPLWPNPADSLCILSWI